MEMVVQLKGLVLTYRNLNGLGDSYLGGRLSPRSCPSITTQLGRAFTSTGRARSTSAPRTPSHWLSLTPLPLDSLTSQRRRTFLFQGVLSSPRQGSFGGEVRHCSRERKQRHDPQNHVAYVSRGGSGDEIVRGPQEAPRPTQKLSQANIWCQLGSAFLPTQIAPQNAERLVGIGPGGLRSVSARNAKVLPPEPLKSLAGSVLGEPGA